LGANDPVVGYLRFNVVLFFTTTVRQRDVLDLFPGSPPGNFATSFPDLDRATAGIQSLDLDSVSRYLQANSSSSEVFEAFGLKIPSEQVTAWGTVVILCIQLSLYIYLRGFKNPLEPSDKAWDVGWFAVNDAFLPRSAFFITVFLLPAMTVFFLTKHFVDQRTENGLRSTFHAIGNVYGFVRAIILVLVLLLPFFVSVLSGYFNWRNRPRVKRETGTSRSQHFE
jgi:hypothetical protein